MKIDLFHPKILNNQNYIKPKYFVRNNLAPLNKDTVSFSANNVLSIKDKINCLPENPLKNSNKIKNILLEDMGLPKDCINIEIADIKDNIGGYFNMNTGNILLNKNFNFSNEELAIVIRHELEHFKQSLGIIKNLGIKRYQSYAIYNANEIASRCPGASTEFNYKLWKNKKLYSSVNITKPQCESYFESLKQRLALSKEPDSKYKELKEIFLYYNAPDEKEAYKAQDELSLELGIFPQTRISSAFTNMFPKIENALDEISAKHSSKCQRSILFDNSYQKAISHFQNNSSMTSDEDIRLIFGQILFELTTFKHYMLF